MKEMIFLAIVAIWVFFGGMGIFYCKNDGTNWWFLIFFVMAPFLAIAGSICGLM